MAAAGKMHLRRCAGCGAMKDKKDLIRVIRNSAGEVLPDETQKQNGRGAYLCRSLSCLEAARRKRGLERALKCGVDSAVYEWIREKTGAAE